ncbi:MAG: hypothetical protein KBF75_02885 [Saprospiraceae bacterium]|jgi:hypothetical protein|nr:hypothetical protein [Saprospiraceae bacterium]HMT78587.1 hypothetical protein [Saprospiraceae bacterium]HQU94597.1 hypothetical protein [Saprospiraceae bacterium]
MFWYSRKTGFPKIKILPELRDDSRLGQCSWTITNISIRYYTVFSSKGFEKPYNADYES